MSIPLSVGELQALDFKDLAELQAKIARAMAVARERDRQLLKGRIVAEAAAAGMSIKDLLMRPRQGKKQRFARDKVYVNPRNGGQTWAGRGRRPAWLAAQLAAGKPLERFLRQS